MYLLTLLGLAVTLTRIMATIPLSIISWNGVDESLAGASLACFSPATGPTRR